MASNRFRSNASRTNRGDCDDARAGADRRARAPEGAATCVRLRGPALCRRPLDTRFGRVPFNEQEVSMNRWTKLLTAIAASAVLASIATTLALAGGAKTHGARVDIAKSPLGRILVDSKGITLYDFPPDKGATSVCYGACAALWPPLITSARPVAGPGVHASLLGTTRRKDGKLEVTYNGHPLYYFVSDRKPGQTTGQGVDQCGAPWWVISPAGKEIHRG